MLQKLTRFAGASAVLISVLSATLGGIKPLAASEGTDVARADLSAPPPGQCRTTPAAVPAAPDRPDGASAPCPSPAFPAAPSAPQSQSGLTFTFEQFYRGTDNALKEFAAARSDHAAIALDIGRCYKEIGDPIQWSPTVRATLLFELDEHLMHSLPYTVGNAIGGGSPGQVLPTLNRFHAAAISFSDRVSRNRLEVRRELEDSRKSSNIYQYLILGLGTAATIFVSIRAIMQTSTGWSNSVGVLAIVFSAGAAAVSSMNTFEGSQATVLRDQRALSQLQQLHWRIASDVLKRSEICTSPGTPPGEEMNVVDAWRSRLETILDSAVESISKPGDISGGGSPSPTRAPVQDVRAEGNALRSDQAGGG